MVDYLHDVIARSLGVPVDRVRKEVIVNLVGKDVELVHPSLIDSEYPVSTMVVFVPSSVEFVKGLLEDYAKLLGGVSPHFNSDLEFSGIRPILKRGLSVVLRYDDIGTVSTDRGFILNYKKVFDKSSYGYAISFNPDLIKYYRNSTKDEFMSKVVKPFIRMFFDMVYLHSYGFVMDDVSRIIEKINLIIEGSFNKSNVSGVSVERLSKEPVIIVLKREAGVDGGVSVIVRNVKRVKIRDKLGY